MKISVDDKNDSGIVSEFAKAIGANVRGRFTFIPESKGAGFLTGFSWGNDLRMMIRNYYLKENVVVAWKNEAVVENENIVFLLTGIFPSPLNPNEKLVPEQANMMICKQGLISIIDMPSNTMFGSVTIRASRQYLHQIFGNIDHPIVTSILEAKGNFVFESVLSAQILNVAGDFIQEPVAEYLEKHYYKLKCEELLCYIFTILMQRETVPSNSMHIDDIKAIYAIKSRLQSQLDKPPNIAFQAREAGMSEPKLRKLFKQTFGKGVFEYFQSLRMQEAARLLKEMRLTVSEVGYRLGFTNMSHFTRVFEQHTGVKPKKYSGTNQI